MALGSLSKDRSAPPFVMDDGVFKAWTNRSRHWLFWKDLLRRSRHVGLTRGKAGYNEVSPGNGNVGLPAWPATTTARIVVVACYDGGYKESPYDEERAIAFDVQSRSPLTHGGDHRRNGNQQSLINHIFDLDRKVVRDCPIQVDLSEPVDDFELTGAPEDWPFAASATQCCVLGREANSIATVESGVFRRLCLLLFSLQSATSEVLQVQSYPGPLATMGPLATEGFSVPAVESQPTC
ncbi:hypothetical protein BD309DRAFT_1012622 [Dichomitus squalens]|nr:hypothetical protein BD309DRAFT_1012622 [Dichomitus squalens]